MSPQHEITSVLNVIKPKLTFTTHSALHFCGKMSERKKMLKIWFCFKNLSSVCLDGNNTSGQSVTQVLGESVNN